MRFQVSQVMDAIELRLTTDVTGAQAVVDLGEVIGYVELDGGRPVNLVRIGMVIDALSRYLLDGGAMLYAVAERALLSESALTSKERMVLSRWADDGLIEVTPAVGDRAVEIADLTGLPLIAVHPYSDLAKRYGWLEDGAGRVLRLAPRSGVAVLSPMREVQPESTGGGNGSAEVRAVGRAKVPSQKQADAPAPGDAADPDAGSDGPEAPDALEDSGGTTASESPAAPESAAAPGSPDAPESPAQSETSGEPEHTEPAADPGGADPGGAEAGGLPLPVEVFTDRDARRGARVRVSRHRYLRAEPNAARASVLAREWRCDGFDCPAFGEYRRIGQPVPRMRGEVPVCPRHDEPVTDVGPRPPAYPVSVVVDDLPRRRLVVRGGQPVPVGRTDDDDLDVVSVAQWLHRAAAAWIDPIHLRLEAGVDGLTVTDVSENGTVVWQRTGPDDPGTTKPLHHESYSLGEWDSVELYTGIELVRGDRRPALIVGRDEPASVLVDAPTAAHRQLGQVASPVATPADKAG